MQLTLTVQMLLLALALVLGSSSATALQQQHYAVSDIGYTIPLCGGTTLASNLSNSLASVQIRNSILGDRLILNFDFRAPVSCYFCEKNALACRTENSSTSAKFVSTRRYDTIAVLTDGNSNATVLGYTNRIKSDPQTSSISFALSDFVRDNRFCGRRFNLVLTTWLSVDFALDEELAEEARFFISGWQETPKAPGSLIECQSNQVYRAMGFNCAVIPWIQPANYEMTNCLQEYDDSQSNNRNATLVTNYGSLYWYNRFLTQNYTAPDRSTLCDMPYDVILYRSNLYLAQCDQRDFFSDWYRLAVRVVTYRLNRNNTPLWALLQATDLLERHCEHTDAIASPTSNYFNKSYQALDFTPDESDIDAADMYCGDIAFFFRNNTVLKDVSILRRWYFEAFRVITLPDKHTETRALIILGAICLTPFIIFGGVVFFHYKVTIRGHKRTDLVRVV